MSDEPDLAEVQGYIDELPRLPPDLMTTEEMLVSESCGAEHPERPGIFCTKKEGRCFQTHATLVGGGEVQTVTWPNIERPTVPQKTPKPGKTAKLAEGKPGPKSAGPASDVWDPKQATAEFGQEEAERAYGATDEAWKRQATAIVMDLRDRNKPFSGNDVWRAGLPVPQNEHGVDERRAIGHVFTRLAKEGYLKNTGKKVTSMYGHGSLIAVWINADL